VPVAGVERLLLRLELADLAAEGMAHAQQPPKLALQTLEAVAEAVAITELTGPVEQAALAL